ncbi:MAG: hypothetical protein DRP66_08660 [Planctomycetota bacterium]|nr:MAG: hypothetical protein DRP66_08660 [Planctomycetota bacterium]
MPDQQTHGKKVLSFAKMTANLPNLPPSGHQTNVVEAVETFTRPPNHADETFQQVMRNYCNCNCLPRHEE